MALKHTREEYLVAAETAMQVASGHALSDPARLAYLAEAQVYATLALAAPKPPVKRAPRAEASQ